MDHAPKMCNILSWNINGKALEKTVLLDTMSLTNEVICIQEHLLSEDNTNLLKFSSSLQCFIRPAERVKSRGRPSGGLATLVRKSLQAELLASSKHFLAVKVRDTVIINVYLPTNYRSSLSDSKFTGACTQLSRFVKAQIPGNTKVLLIGDFNCDLLNTESERTQIVIGSLPDQLNVVDKDKAYTFISVANTVSNLDHVLTNFPVSDEVKVAADGSYSDHLPLSLSITLDCPKLSGPCKSQWRVYSDWKQVSNDLFAATSGDILSKIKVPFHLLQRNANSYCSESEIRLQINMYCAEISHALSIAESVAVPVKRIRNRSQVKGWSRNPELAAACASAKLWLKVWHDSGKPRSGIVNEIRIHTKRKFNKALDAHRATLKENFVQKLSKNPNLIWSLRSKPEEAKPTSNISANQWSAYFESEFKAPDPVLQSNYENELTSMLTDTFDDFSVSPVTICQAVKKLKKVYSKGCDSICALHISLGGYVLYHHIALLFQMILTQGIVPSCFSLGMVIPILKKGKPAEQPSSYRPVTISSVFCKLFEIVLFDEIYDKCEMPPHQFGFRKGLGCTHVLYLLANILLDAHLSRETLILGQYDVRRAFDSGIHAQILVELCKRGVRSSIVRSLRDMYRNLKLRVRLQDGELSGEISVHKGIKQGAITSPTLYNNSVNDAQQVISPSYICKHIDLSLLGFADDLLNLSRLLSSLENNFSRLEKSYADIGLQFNVEKSAVLFFNCPEDNATVRLGGITVTPSSHITYLGLPIGRNLRETQSLLIEHLSKKVRIAYAGVVTSRRNSSRKYLARLYNAVALPHVLYLSPFWKLLSARNKKDIRSVFFKYARYLLQVPPFVRNRHIVAKYGIVEPLSAVEEVIQNYVKKLELLDHEWAHLLK